MTAQQSTPSRSGFAAWSSAQRFAAALGLVYFLVGAVGFVVTGFSDFTGMHHHTLLIFSINPLHNVVHLLLGVVWLASSARHAAATITNLVFGVVLGLVTFLGFIDGMAILGMSGLGDPDNFLHLATATLSLYFGSVAAGTPGSADDRQGDGSSDWA